MGEHVGFNAFKCVLMWFICVYLCHPKQTTTRMHVASSPPNVLVRSLRKGEVLLLFPLREISVLTEGFRVGGR